MKLFSVLLSVGLVSLSGCTSDEMSPVADQHSDAATLVLSGSALAEELQDSQPHRSHEPFLRIGAMIDATAVDMVQLATSEDGNTWSAWHTITPTRVEPQTGGLNFIGELVLDRPALFFRLRGNVLNTSFVRIDTLAASNDVSEAIGEIGEKENQSFTGAGAFGNGYVFRTRKDWGATAVSCNTPMKQKKITIHHTDTPANDPEARVRQIQAYHRGSQGWCDIGYHFLVDEQGVVYEGRRISTVGAHAYGANTDNVGIALIGSYENAEPTAEQLSSTAKLAADVAKEYGITLSSNTVKGHRQVGSTSTDCPGARVFDKLSSIVDAANGKTPEPELPPPTPPAPDEPDQGASTDATAGCAASHSGSGATLVLIAFVMLRRRRSHSSGLRTIEKV